MVGSKGWVEVVCTHSDELLEREIYGFALDMHTESR